VHAAVALAHARDANRADAETSFRRAIDLAPSRSRTRVDFAMWRARSARERVRSRRS
jgi:hypothetical protein